MKLLLTVGDEDNGRLPILSVEVISSDLEVTENQFQKVYETTLDTEMNKLLNDYTNVVCTPGGSGFSLDFTGASETPDARKMSLDNWKPRTRPALMRATTTTHFFNL